MMSFLGLVLNWLVLMLVQSTRRWRSKVCVCSSNDFAVKRARDANRAILYLNIIARRLLDDGIQCLHQSSVAPGESASYVVLNTLGWTRSEIIEIPSQAGDRLQQYSAEKNTGYVRGISKSIRSRFIIKDLLEGVLKLISLYQL